MADNQDWRAGAKAELSARFYALMDDLARYAAEEKEARERKEEAHGKAKSLIDAAALLGFVIEGFEEAEAEAKAEQKKSDGGITAREIIMDALKKVFPKPLRAAELRQIIEQRIGRPIHTKTPGMTLYRLGEEGLVRREGHSWFAVEGDQLRLDEQRQEALII